MTSFGEMTEMRARHVAALSSQDRATSTKALEHLRRNLDAAPDMLLEALVREERFDGAAAEFERRLADPELRWSALALVQEYRPYCHQ